MKTSAYRENVKHSKRKSIVTAAIDAFLEDGFEKAGMTNIAKVADVSTATLYKHFPSKEALFVAITEQLIVDNDPEFPGDELFAMDLEAGLIHVGNMFAATLNKPQLVPLYRLVIAEAYRFPELRDLIHDRGLSPYTDKLQAFVEAKTKAGEVNLGAARASFPVQQFIGMLSYLLLYSRVLDGQQLITLPQAQAVVLDCARTIAARFSIS